jgi:hypothetical protein
MNKIVLWIFSKTKFGQMLDGKKTVIGAAFIILARLLDALQAVAPLFPQYPWLLTASEQMAGFMGQLETLLNDLGFGLLTVGVLHKSIKAKLPS